jgi:hypothetical protein
MMLPAGWIDKMHRPLIFDQMRNAKPAIKVEQIRATAEQHMLAIIERLSRLRILKRTGPPAQRSARFDERDIRPDRFQRNSGRHASQAAADDDDARGIFGGHFRWGLNGGCKSHWQ